MISGQPEVEEGIDEELVPEDVPAICLAVEAASRDAGVVMGGQPRAHLQEMRGVEAQQELDALRRAEAPRRRPPRARPTRLLWPSSASSKVG